MGRLSLSPPYYLKLLLRGYLSICKMFQVTQCLALLRVILNQTHGEAIPCSEYNISLSCNRTDRDHQQVPPIIIIKDHQPPRTNQVHQVCCHQIFSEVSHHSLKSSRFYLYLTSPPFEIFEIIVNNENLFLL